MSKRKIALVYTGYEQGTWGDIAFRKEQFYHFMPGILYLASAIKNSPATSGTCDVVTRHYNTTVQNFDEIVTDLIELSPDCIGFGCYCWNLPLHKKVARTIKEKLPEARMIFGGPEIIMKSEEEYSAFFEECPEADLIVFGDAEMKIATLVQALLDRSFEQLSGVAGYCFNPRYGTYSRIESEDCTALSELPKIYPCPIEVKHSPDSGIFVVYEGSRGCPNRCIYCQFIRKRKKQEYFPFERIESELKWLLEQEVDGIHFADAVFDKDPEITGRLLRFIAEHNRRSTILCYCTFDTLNEELAELYEKVQCQIGVGVQSTNKDVLRILRRSHSKRLFNEASQILAGREVNFYVDLMFGLPGDTMDSFRKSFEETITLHPNFIMLFSLALIKGTALGDNPDAYGVIPYSDEDIKNLNLQCDIEYLNLALSGNFQLSDLELFDDVTLTCFYYYNRFHLCMSYLHERCEGGLFELYRMIGRKTKDFLIRTGQKPSNRGFSGSFKDEIQVIYKEVLDMTGAGPKEQNAFRELYKIDMYRLTVLRSPNREKIFNKISSLEVFNEMPDTIEPSMRLIKSTFGKAITIENPLDELLHLNEKQEMVKSEHGSIYIHAPYSRADTIILPLSEEQSFIIDLLTTDRALRFKSVVTAFRQNFRRTAGENKLSEEYIYGIIAELFGLDIIRILK